MPSTCCQQVIWAILPTNMGHITDQYGPYYKPTPTPSPREGSLKKCQNTAPTLQI